MSDQWKPGDRVQRSIFIDDGTWMREGDSCLVRETNFRRGTVLGYENRISPYFGWTDRLVLVQWDDDGSVKGYFDHGVQYEVGL